MYRHRYRFWHYLFSRLFSQRGSETNPRDASTYFKRESILSTLNSPEAKNQTINPSTENVKKRCRSRAKTSIGVFVEDDKENTPKRKESLANTIIWLVLVVWWVASLTSSAIQTRPRDSSGTDARKTRTLQTRTQSSKNAIIGIGKSSRAALPFQYALRVRAAMLSDPARVCDHRSSGRLLTFNHSADAHRWQSQTHDVEQSVCLGQSLSRRNSHTDSETAISRRK